MRIVEMASSALQLRRSGHRGWHVGTTYAHTRANIERHIPAHMDDQDACHVDDLALD